MVTYLTLCDAGYVAVRAVSHANLISAAAWPTINLTAVSILGSCMSFFVVFYTSQSYSRFNDQYNACMALEGRCMDICLLARACMRDRAAAFRLMRHVMAAHVLGYTGLHSAYTGANFFTPFNDKFALLTPAETARMADIGTDNGGGCYREVVAWAVEGVQQQHAAGLVDDRNTELLLIQILALRSKLGTLFDYADQPIPFPLIHLMYLVSILYLPLFAYAVAHTLQTASPTSLADELLGGLTICIRRPRPPPLPPPPPSSAPDPPIPARCRGAGGLHGSLRAVPLPPPAATCLWWGSRPSRTSCTTRLTMARTPSLLPSVAARRPRPSGCLLGLRLKATGQPSSPGTPTAADPDRPDTRPKTRPKTRPADIEDLSVTHYVTFTITACRRIMWGDPLGALDPQEEAELEASRPPLGQGFLGRCADSADALDAWPRARCADVRAAPAQPSPTAAGRVLAPPTLGRSQSLAAAAAHSAAPSAVEGGGDVAVSAPQQQAADASPDGRLAAVEWGVRAGVEAAVRAASVVGNLPLLRHGRGPGRGVRFSFSSASSYLEEHSRK